MISWFAIVASLFAAAYIYQRMKRQEAEELSEPDEGQAILDFGRAFPDEAIRAIHPTADGHAFFVRLHDGKAGIVLSQGRHYLCHLIVPSKVRITHAQSGRGLALSFNDTATFDGTYEFSNTETAAEVSLWILGSFSS
ncbi:hypothetical protein DFI02_106166 [Rhizobium sp. PP-F2F-G20b]|nr:hypothetical protein DFI02_106166 [Rhizobium sp. PP-F2F-G20b]